MTRLVFARPHIAAAAALAFATAIIMTGAARGDAANYAFQLVRDEAGQGAPKPGESRQGEAELSARLIDTRNGRPVLDAVIFAKRLDMAPDGMEAMTSTIEAAPSSEPGVHRFKARLTMAGRWRLSLAAKVQGERDTVTGRLIVRALASEVESGAHDDKATHKGTEP